MLWNVGNQKDRFNETALLSLKLMGKKIFTILRSNILFDLTNAYMSIGNVNNGSPVRNILECQHASS